MLRALISTATCLIELQAVPLLLVPEHDFFVHGPEPSGSLNSLWWHYLNICQTGFVTNGIVDMLGILKNGYEEMGHLQ